MSLFQTVKVVGSTELDPSVALSDTFASALIDTGVRVRRNPLGMLVSEMDSLHITLEDIAGASDVQVFLSSDEDGDHPISPVSDPVDIVPGLADPTKGRAILKADFTLSSPGVQVDSEDRARVYLWVVLGAGTATMTHVEIVTRP